MTSNALPRELVPAVPNAGGCYAEGGWYYAEERTRVVLCDSTCAQVLDLSDGYVEYRGPGCDSQ